MKHQTNFYQENVYKLQKQIYNKLKSYWGGVQKEFKIEIFLRYSLLAKTLPPKQKKLGEL